jgi:outer membrane translocation and assembly module TamA
VSRARSSSRAPAGRLSGLAALITVAGIALHLPSARAAEIVEIRFAGNHRTRPETLLREMLVRPGDPADPELIERSRQAIMDLELFKSVEARLEPEAAGRVLVITVEEKRYVFVLPVLGRSDDGDVTYGAQIRVDNFRGLDHRLRVELKRKDLRSDADIDDERTLELRYQAPRLRNGAWTLDALGLLQRALLEENRDGAMGKFERDSSRLDLLASRWLVAAGPSRGWRFGGGISVEDFRFQLLGGEPSLFFDTTEIGLLGRFGYHDVHAFEFTRVGRDLEIALAGHAEALGAAKDRLSCAVRWRVYRPVTSRRLTNLEYQVRAAMVNESLFGEPAFDLGGASGLRGYPRERVEGDAFVVANLEFITPISRLDALRGVVFADAGSVLGEPDETGLVTSAGVGLRAKLRAFVRVDLRLDVAHGFDGSREGQTRVYAGSEATF